MESLTQEQDKIVQMGTIKASKGKALAMGVSNASKGKKKARYLKQSDKRKPNRPKTTDGGLNPPK